MFRNQYDTDVTVWSPQGHLHQIDYAMEAVKQGSACLGLTSSKFAVLCGIKRQSLELAEHQKKVFKIDDHMGIAISGLTADARTLARFMRTESLNHKFVYGSAITVGRLVSDVADKKQECTQSYIRRPYGVGLLVAGVDVRAAAAGWAIQFLEERSLTICCCCCCNIFVFSSCRKKACTCTRRVRRATTTSTRASPLARGRSRRARTWKSTLRASPTVRQIYS